MLNHTFHLVFELNLIGICICVDNATFFRSATALMEVERATPPGFEEEILKPPEVNNITIMIISITILTTSITIITVFIFTILTNIFMLRSYNLPR